MTTPNTDERLEAAAEALNNPTMTHLWIMGGGRCICGFTGTYQELHHHNRVERARPVLAAADAVDPLRSSGVRVGTE